MSHDPNFGKCENCGRVTVFNAFPPLCAMCIKEIDDAVVLSTIIFNKPIEDLKEFYKHVLNIECKLVTSLGVPEKMIQPNKI